MRNLTLLLFAFLLLGCVPCSERPLSAPGQDKLDGALYGTWIHKEDDETIFIHFGQDYNSKLMKAVFVDLKKNGELESHVFTGYNTNSKESGYLNLKWDECDVENCKGYLFVKYTVSENALGICVIDSEAVEKPVKSGELKGELGKGQGAPSVTLTDEPEKMKAYVEKHDKELFPEMQSFQRFQAP